MSTIHRMFQLAVEALLADRLSYGDEAYEVWVYPYLNGREKGLAFHFHKGKDGEYVNLSPFEASRYDTFYVSEHRNSDCISIRCGVAPDWQEGYNDLDHVYRAYTIPPGRADLAVEKILELVGTPRATEKES